MSVPPPGSGIAGIRCKPSPSCYNMNMKTSEPVIGFGVRVLPGMLSQPQVLTLVLAALTAFAANSILARLAFTTTAIDPILYTLVRIVAGAALLGVLVFWRAQPGHRSGDWGGAATLIVYAFAFSFAYLYLDAATGALIMFAWAQMTMMTAGLLRGERLNTGQSLGFALAVVGIIVLLLPHAAAPTWPGIVLMSLSGIAWGLYSLRGHVMHLALATTSGNFLRAAPVAVLIALIGFPLWEPDLLGFVYAALSGALTTGLGYALWYRVLPELRTTHASVAQLAVPVLAAVLGILLLAEPLTLRFGISVIAVLGGIGLVILLRNDPITHPAHRRTGYD